MKKILSTILIGISPFLAQAQDKFMGISSLPIGEDHSTQILYNAIRDGDTVMLEKWDKEIGIQIPYKEKLEEYCTIDLSKNDLFFRPDTFKPVSPDFAHQNLAIGKIYPFFAKCMDLSILHIANKFQDINNISEVRELTEKKVKKPIKPEYEAHLRKIVNEINPMLWEQLIYVVMNDAIPFDIRKTALQKIIDIYPTKEKVGNDYQIRFWNSALKYTQNPNNAQFYANHNTYLLSLNPLQYIYNDAFLKVASNALNVGKSEELTKALSKDFFLGKTNISYNDLLNIKGKKEKDARTSAYFLQKNLEIMNLLKESQLVKADYQTFIGNTMVHALWYKQGMLDRGGNSRVLANFLRAQFEMGFNPMILNSNKETSYALFEKLSGSMKPTHSQPIREAFTLKEYNY